MNEKDGKQTKNNNTCRSFEKEIIVDKVRNHCHLSDKVDSIYRDQLIRIVMFLSRRIKESFNPLQFLVTVFTLVICFPDY